MSPTNEREFTSLRKSTNCETQSNEDWIPRSEDESSIPVLEDSIDNQDMRETKMSHSTERRKVRLTESFGRFEQWLWVV